MSDTVEVIRADLAGMQQGLELIIILSREEMSLAGSTRAGTRPREIGIAARTMQGVVEHYLKQQGGDQPAG